ncbi:hypothetical protein [Polaribacter sp.]|uniref:hypothetical protein n=1 Tax=Polaribacter sp. TaxID=1920175 RepID=UPI003F6D5F1E
MKKIFFLLCITGISVFGQNENLASMEDYNFILGTNSFPTKYQFTNYTKLIEQAKQTKALGSNIFKTTISEKKLKDYGYKPKDVDNIMDVLDLIPDYQKIFNMDFKYFFFWVHTATKIKWKNGISKQQEKRLYKEIFNFTSFLLKEYNNTGKTFFIGNWEGDWLLHGEGNKKSNPSKETVANMTKWLQIRQRAIADAKNKSKSKNVNVYYYIEVNLALKGMDGGTCITKDILPNVDVDFVSYSSYESSKKKDYQTNKKVLTKVLDYIESQLKPKKGLPFKRRVFIGEYGGHAFDDRPQTHLRQFDNVKDIMQISIEEDLPFALHWQLYNNEYAKNGKSKHMSLINEEGKKRPMYFLHQNYYIQLNDYLKNYKQQNKTYPSQTDFKNKALEVLDIVYSEIRPTILASITEKN